MFTLLFTDLKMAGRLEDEDMATCVAATVGVLGLLLTIFGISSLGLGVTAGWYYIYHENAGYAYIPLWGGCVVSILGPNVFVFFGYHQNHHLNVGHPYYGTAGGYAHSLNVQKYKSMTTLSKCGKPNFENK